jgi:hypothetical protein
MGTKICSGGRIISNVTIQSNAARGPLVWGLEEHSVVGVEHSVGTGR